jgi:hypothetical protein
VPVQGCTLLYFTLFRSSAVHQLWNTTVLSDSLLWTLPSACLIVSWQQHCGRYSLCGSAEATCPVFPSNARLVFHLIFYLGHRDYWLNATKVSTLTLILLMWRIRWAPNSIPIHIQQDATLHSLFISGNSSTCFGWYFHPSSGAHTTVYTASDICHTVTATCRYRGRDGIGLSVLWVAYAPDDGWKYHPKRVEQFPDISKLCNVASCWIYTCIGIYLRCTDPSTLNLLIILVNGRWDLTRRLKG